MRSIALASVATLLCLVAACATGPSGDRTTQKAAADAVGSDSGVASGPTGGPPTGTGGRRLLDDHERRRLVDAARVAFAATGDATTSYTIVPQNIDAEPTIVSATPAGPLETRADGNTCRPLKLSATKHWHTTVGTLTFCQAAGSTELKPATRL